VRAKVQLFLSAVACCSLVGGGTANAVDRPQSRGASATKSAPIRLDGNGLGVVGFGATVSTATKVLTARLGAPTGHPSAGCTSAYNQTAWHDLIIQFKAGRFTGYRYVAGGWNGISPSSKTLHATVTPKLATSAGISLRSTMAEATRAYPSLRRSGTDFWRLSNGIVFAFYTGAHANPSSTSPIYEIKNNVCPGSL